MAFDEQHRGDGPGDVTTPGEGPLDEKSAGQGFSPADGPVMERTA
jgi:hypothetical protein